MIALYYKAINKRVSELKRLGLNEEAIKKKIMREFTRKSMLPQTRAWKIIFQALKEGYILK